MLDLFAAISSSDPPSLVAWLVFAFAAGMYPLGIMLGAPCSPCCDTPCYYGTNVGTCAAWGGKSIRIQAEGVVANIPLVGWTIGANDCEWPLFALSSSAGRPAINPYLWPAGSSASGVGAAPGIGDSGARRFVEDQDGCLHCVTVGPDVHQLIWPCQRRSGATEVAHVRLRWSLMRLFVQDSNFGTAPGACYPNRRPSPAIWLEYSVLDGTDGAETYREHWAEYVNAFTFSCSNHSGNLIYLFPTWTRTGHNLGTCNPALCCNDGLNTAYSLSHDYRIGPPLYSPSLV